MPNQHEHFTCRRIIFLYRVLKFDCNGNLFLYNVGNVGNKYDIAVVSSVGNIHSIMTKYAIASCTAYNFWCCVGRCKVFHSFVN